MSLGTHRKLGSAEKEYFHRLDVELIDRMRRQAAIEEERLRFAKSFDIDNKEILDELATAGFEHRTAALLPLVPLIEVAWIDGSVSPAERDRIVAVARIRGIEEGGHADRQLIAWLDVRPSNQFFRTAVNALREVLGSLSEIQSEANVTSLLRSCVDIAAASGGFFGLADPVSPAERKALVDLADEMELSRSSRAGGL